MRKLSCFLLFACLVLGVLAAPARADASPQTAPAKASGPLHVTYYYLPG